MSVVKTWEPRGPHSMSGGSGNDNISERGMQYGVSYLGTGFQQAAPAKIQTEDRLRNNCPANVSHFNIVVGPTQA